VYSLGVMLFELLTGELPFRGNARMMVHQVIHDEPPHPRKLNGSVPKDLDTLVMHCLEKSPARRFQRAQEFADELNRFLRNEPIRSRPTSRMERGWRCCRRNPVVAGLSSAVVLSLTSAAIISSLSYFRAERARQEAAGDLARVRVAEADAQRQRNV